MSQNLDQRLIIHGVRPTAVRTLILHTLDKAEKPLAALDIENILDTIDRSTITRALAIFHDKGLVHLIDDGTGAAKYESCPSHDGHHSDDQHVHFHCKKCSATFCLHDTAIPAICLPSGFQADSSNYIITGICPNCSKK